MLRWLIVAAVIAGPSLACAQDFTSRQIGALPTLVQQRNEALDRLALCTGDTVALQQKLDVAERELKAAREKVQKLEPQPQSQP